MKRRNRGRREKRDEEKRKGEKRRRKNKEEIMLRGSVVQKKPYQTQGEHIQFSFIYSSDIFFNSFGSDTILNSL